MYIVTHTVELELYIYIWIKSGQIGKKNGCWLSEVILCLRVGLWDKQGCFWKGMIGRDFFVKICAFMVFFFEKSNKVSYLFIYSFLRLLFLKK